jgi:hypothetical protein
MRFWLNLVGYQLVWLAVVWSAGTGRPWFGIAATVAFVCAQTLASEHRNADVALVAVAAAFGILLDGLLAHNSIVRYADTGEVPRAPTWILALWAAFAMTLNHSLAWLRGHVVAAALLGAIGGPLAYLAAARGFDAVALPEPRTTAIIALAFGWALALATLVRLAEKWTSARTSGAKA